MFDVCELINENKKYYIFGITGLGTYCCDMITQRYGQDTILGFIQSAPQKENHLGKKIYSVQQAVAQATDSDMFILAALKKTDEMKKILLDYGISEDAIIDVKQYGFVVRQIPVGQTKNIFLWPPIEVRNIDLSDKIKWFAPDRIKVSICSSNPEVKSDFADAENVEFISDEYIERELADADYIAVWDVKKRDSIIEPYRHKIHIIDPDFYYLTEVTNFRYMYFSSFSENEKENFRQHSLDVFKRMKEEFSNVERANVFCTGPSIKEAWENYYIGDFNIICNSMVKDREFLEKIKPSMLTFGDLAFYLSPNEYCKAFYKDLLETYEKYHYYIVVSAHEVPLLKKHFPMLYDRVIGVECTNRYCLPNDSELYVKDTANICTIFMIPFASAICDKIGIAGCTGRDPDESYFWEHNDRCQYLDLMHFVFEAYPSFFRHQNYEDYYEQHCAFTEELIQYGEKRGKVYTNLTTSFIPALKERTEKI